jgi:hypothetical protein
MPLGVFMCQPECSGYAKEPKVGELWPRETEEDFGYPVSTDGTEEALTGGQ